jgi:hypothetical protein
MSATPQEIADAVAAMKKATIGIIHAKIMASVPGMFQEKAEGMVNDIEAKLLPLAAKVCIETTDASRAKAAAALPPGAES